LYFCVKYQIQFNLNKRNNRSRRTQKQHRLNKEIRAYEVRIINDGEGFSKGVFSSNEALNIAEGLGLDLILINDKPNPPLCQIEEYGKFLYNEKRKQKDLKEKSNKMVTKTLRFSSTTGDHDIEVNANKAIDFLKKGYYVKCDLIFKGRNIVFKERGTEVLLKFAQLVEDYGTPEEMPKMQGKKMLMTVKPKTKKK